KTYGDADFAISATASSSLAVSFAASGNCTVAGANVHLTGAGACTITASQGGDTNYNAAPDVAQSFQINKADSTMHVSVDSVTYDGNAHTATGTATGVESPNPADLSSLLDLNGTTHTNAGSYPADAWSFAGNNNYNAASSTVSDQIDQSPSAVTVNCPANE